MVDEEDPVCRVCGSTDVTRASFRVDVKNSLASRRYTCKKCGSTFTAGKMRHYKTPEYVVRLTVGLGRVATKKGLLLHEVAAMVTEATGIQVKASTVGVWLKKFDPEYKPHLGRMPDPRKAWRPADVRKGGRYYYYKASRTEVSARTLRSLKAKLRYVAGRLEALEERAKKAGS